MKLIFVEGVFAGRQEILKPVGSVIGRVSSADIHIDDQGISRQHCRISRVEGKWLIEDLGSVNGVSVNGVRVAGSTALQPGDRIAILTSVMTFVDESAPMPVVEEVRPALSAETSQPSRMPLTEPPVNVPPAVAAAPGAIAEAPEPHGPPKLSLPRRPSPPPPPPPPLHPAATGMPRPPNATVGHSPIPRPIPLVPAPPPVFVPEPQSATSLAPVQTVEPSGDDNRSQLWMRMVLIVVVLALAALLVVVLKQPAAPVGAGQPGGGGTVNVLTPPGTGSANTSTVPMTDQVLLVPIPENGEILLEGTKPITAPALVPGKNSTVVIRKPGYKDILIPMGKGKMPSLVFEPKPLSALVTSAPSGAAVYKDGQFLGRTPYVVSDLPIGSYVLTVGGQDTRPVQVNIAINPRSGSPNTYHVPLTKMPTNP